MTTTTTTPLDGSITTKARKRSAPCATVAPTPGALAQACIDAAQSVKDANAMAKMARETLSAAVNAALAGIPVRASFPVLDAAGVPTGRSVNARDWVLSTYGRGTVRLAKGERVDTSTTA